VTGPGGTSAITSADHFRYSSFCFTFLGVVHCF
jgi:hypothetical protein